MNQTSRLLLLCAVIAWVIRALFFIPFSNSVLFLPDPDSVHDRAIYLRAIETTAQGRFFPEGAFDYLPLYPWVVGLFAAVFGASPVLAACVGIACDVATVVLLFMLARHLGARPGWAAAGSLLYAAYPLAVMYSLLTMPNSLNTLLVTAFVFLAARFPPLTPRRQLGLGLFAGVAALGFAGMLLVAIALMATSWWKHRDAMSGKRMITGSVMAAIGLLIPIAPVAWHNTNAEGRFVLLTTHGGFNFYLGNHDVATGYPLRVKNFRMNAKTMLEDAHAHAEQATGQTLTRAESSAWWKAQANAFWREYPAAALTLTAKKVLLFWNAREMDDLRMIEQLRISDPVFRYGVGVPFALLSTLGLFGLVAARNAAIPRAALLAGMTGLVLFFITSRYRLTLTPLMALMGMLALSQTFASNRRRSLLLLAPAALVVWIPFSVRDQRPVDYYNVAIQLMSAQRMTAAGEIIRSGLAIASDSADLHFALGSLLFREEKYPEAAAAFSDSLARHPQQPIAVYNLALSLGRAGRYCDAYRALEKARAANIPLEPRTLRLMEELKAACP